MVRFTLILSENTNDLKVGSLIWRVRPILLTLRYLSRLSLPILFYFQSMKNNRLKRENSPFFFIQYLYENQQHLLQHYMWSYCRYWPFVDPEFVVSLHHLRKTTNNLAPVPNHRWLDGRLLSTFDIHQGSTVFLRPKNHLAHTKTNLLQQYWTTAASIRAEFVLGSTCCLTKFRECVLVLLRNPLFTKI